MEKIEGKGIESARKRENQFHPKDPASGKEILAWDYRAQTLRELVRNTNALIDHSGAQYNALTALTNRVAALEAKPPIPFPGSS